MFQVKISLWLKLLHYLLFNRYTSFICSFKFLALPDRDVKISVEVGIIRSIGNHDDQLNISSKERSKLQYVWYNCKHGIVHQYGFSTVFCVGLIVFSAFIFKPGSFFLFAVQFGDGMVMFSSALFHKVWRIVQTGYFQILSPGHVKYLPVFHIST